VTLDLTFQDSYSQTYSGPVPGVSEFLDELNTELEVGFAEIGVSPVFGLDYSLVLSASAEVSLTVGVNIPVAVDISVSGSCSDGMTNTFTFTPSAQKIGPTISGSATVSATLSLSPSIGVEFDSLLTVSGSVSPYLTSTYTTNNDCLSLSAGVNGAVDASLDGVALAVVDVLDVFTNIPKSWSWPYTVYPQTQIYGVCRL